MPIKKNMPPQKQLHNQNSVFEGSVTRAQYVKVKDILEDKRAEKSHIVLYSMENEKLMTREELSRVWVLRKLVNEMNIIEGMEFILEKMRETKDNKDFLRSMNS